MTPKNGFQILNLHPKKTYIKKKSFFYVASYFCLSNSYPKSSNFQLFLFILKMKQYVCRNLYENFRQKMKKLALAYASRVVGSREVNTKSASNTTCREGWGWVTGLNYWFFFHWKTLCIIPTLYVLCNKQTREDGPGSRACPFSSAGWLNFSIIFGLEIPSVQY